MNFENFAVKPTLQAILGAILNTAGGSARAWANAGLSGGAWANAGLSAIDFPKVTFIKNLYTQILADFQSGAISNATALAYIEWMASVEAAELAAETANAIAV